MIGTLLTMLLVVLLGHYAYIVPDILLASIATVMAIMISLGLITNNIRKD